MKRDFENTVLILYSELEDRPKFIILTFQKNSRKRGKAQEISLDERNEEKRRHLKKHILYIFLHFLIAMKNISVFIYIYTHIYLFHSFYVFNSRGIGIRFCLNTLAYTVSGK